VEGIGPESLVVWTNAKRKTPVGIEFVIEPKSLDPEFLWETGSGRPVENGSSQGRQEKVGPAGGEGKNTSKER